MVWLTQLPDNWWNTYTSFLSDPLSITALTDELFFITRTLLIETRVYARVCKRICLSTNDFSVALNNRRIEQFQKSSSDNQNMIISLSSVIERANRLITPFDGIKMTMHWLAIDGEEPIIPENRTPNFDQKNSVEIRSIFNCQPKVTADIIQQQSPMIQKLFAMSIAAQEQGHLKWSHRVDPLTMNNLSLKPIYPRQVPLRHSFNQQSIPSTSMTCLAHELSVEQQFYFKMLTETCFNGSEDERTNAFRSLSTDAALQPLLPRLLLFIQYGIHTNIFLRDLLFVIRFLSILKMLTINKHISFEKYLSLIIPCLLTCLSCIFDLPKATSQQSTAEKQSSNNYSTLWILREQASDLLIYFQDRYSMIPRLTQRIVSILKTNLISNSMNKTYSIIYASLRTLLQLNNIKSILSIDEILSKYSSSDQKFDVDFDLDPIEQRTLFIEKMNVLLQKSREFQRSFSFESIHCTD